MNRTKTLLATLLMASITIPAMAQERPSASIYLQPLAKGPVKLTFAVNGEGHRFAPTWGLDLAWLNEQNLRKGINHMGKENIGIGRSAFRIFDAMPSPTTLSTDQVEYLTKRSNLFDLVSTTLPVVLNSDVGAGVDEYYSKNRRANVERWVQVINAHTQWMLNNTKHPVAAVSPFNDPDFSTEQGTKAQMGEIAKKLKQEFPLFATIPITGGNTLNTDRAIEWYSSMKDWVEWGNTHQLAGSFDNYVSFHQLLHNDGKVGYNDEMHNVAEAMIGLEYGLTIGIWWGFDSRARGEFCDISRNGERLAYGENRSAWTAASVYRHDNGAVKAFIGSSERQAATSSYQFVCTDRSVYYDGYGPVRETEMEIPGGTGYQVGQTNAERVIDVVWGEDVPPRPITAGQYILMNKASKSVASVYGTFSGHSNISQTFYKGQPNQQWNVAPADPRVGGDYSFYDFTCVNDGKRMDVLNFSTTSGSSVIAYTNESPSTNEQWYLEYAGDGYYYIRNRESALCLTLQQNRTSNGINIIQYKKMDNPITQLWRLLPIDAACEQVAPAQPQGLTARPLAAAVELSWEANTEDDLDSYQVLRCDVQTGEWNTIARGLTSTLFIDNTCRPGHHYTYKVKAMDRSLNQSEPSATVDAAPTAKPSLVALYDFEDDLNDASQNMMDAATYGTPTFASDYQKTGRKSLMLSGGRFVQLPYEIASSDELTVTMWVNWRSTSGAWQRLFDFGNDTDHYLFLTPSNGSVMRFGIKNGGAEQMLDAPVLGSLSWKHVALSLGRERTTIFVDGQQVATTTAITIRPSDICPALNYIGRSQFDADPALLAYIDDVRVFNYALDEKGVQNVMNNISSVVLPPVAEPSGDEPVWNLGGQRMRPGTKGIAVKQGRKEVRR